MKNLLLILSFFALAIFAGCGDSNNKDNNNAKYEIYENHEITACGIDDLLTNISWLKNYCYSVINENKYSEASIYLLKNIHTDENYFAIYFPSEIDEYYMINYFNCLKFHCETSTPPSPYYDEFMQDRKLLVKHGV